MELIPIKVRRKEREFDLAEDVLLAFKQNNQEILDSDILVLSSKYVSISEGRFLDLQTVKPTRRGSALARRLSMDVRMAELVVRESEDILGGVPHFALSLKDGSLAPNAGIDRSNFFPGFVTLYPRNPFRSAEDLRITIEQKTSKKVGVVLSDSRLQPLRLGTTGIAVGVSGFEPVKDERGRTDLFGNTLKVTQRNLADDLSSAAQILMGETDEGVPIVDVRDSKISLTDTRIERRNISIGRKRCIYLRSLGKASG